MRLTLRTLLAYMDGELERLYPQEAQEIGKKIEGSKFATDLFHKVRDVTRRLRLAAPSVTERGANLDCNTVAEYLDNELPDDRVPDFEEVCLKSEMHLAEVASCHQILAVAQVELMEVELESRERMYQLPAVAGRVDEERQAAVEAASVLSGDGAASAAAAAPPPASGYTKTRPRPVVPEYLRDPPKKRRLLPAVAITLLLGALLALVLIALGLTKPDTPIGKFLAWADEKISGKHDAANGPGDTSRQPGGEGAKASVGTAASSGAGAASPSGATIKPSDPQAGTPASAVASSGASTLGTAGSTAAPPGEQPAPRPGDMPDLLPPDVGPPANVAPPPGVAPIQPNNGQGGSAARATGTRPPIVPVPPPRVTIVPPPAEGASTPPATGPGAVPPPPQPLHPAGGTATPPGANQLASATRPPPANPRGASDNAKVARYTSAGQDVLLTFDAAGGSWRRAMPEEFFTAGQRLLELPCYRSQIDVFAVGARIELSNGTRIEILQSGPQTPLGIALDFGRMVVKPLAQAGARLRVVAGPHTGTLTLASLESLAAFEMSRIHEPGTDPEKVHSHALTKLYVAAGSATWEEAGKRPAQLAAPTEFPLDGAPAREPRSASGRAPEMPKWIAANTLNELDQRTALVVSQALPADRSAAMSLLELTEDRRIDVKKLAARCLGYLGQFDPLRSALDNADYRGAWPDYFGELKGAIARGPETAAAIRQSLERQFGTDAPALYRMLWGYTDKDLEGGEDARLVKDLDNETLIFRVLAFCNLNEITRKGHYYRADLPAAKRLQAVQEFKKDLRLGQIRWSSAVPAPRTAPAAPPAKAPAARPAEGDAPEEIKPASATEPLDGPRPARPKLVFPEPGG